MLSKLNYRILRKLDEKILVRYLNFELYYSFHEFFGFPLKKLDFFYTHGYHLNLKNPITFNEKIVYRQLFIKDALLSMIVDKNAVREYVKEKIGAKYLVPVLQVADSFDEIDFNALPNSYVIKVNHGSGRNIFCKNREIFCKNKKYNDKKEIKNIINNWLMEKYRFQELICFVQPLKRKIIIEKLLINDKGKIPNDYKFFVFDGKVEFVSVIDGRFSDYMENLFDRDWNEVFFTFTDPDPINYKSEKPLLFDELVSIAETLAADFTHMRVDLYTIGFDIYFGELTPCHANAHDGFVPLSYDEYFGEKWVNSNSLIRKDK